MKHQITNSHTGQIGKTISYLFFTILFMGFALGFSPGAFATDDIVFNLDAQGPDDVPNQSDISQSGFSDVHLVAPFDPYDSAYFDVSWTFDDTDRTGANSADACAFFDSDDAEGFADFAMCASFQENATQTGLELVEVALFDCKNSEPKPDEGARCPFTGGGGDGSSGVIASWTGNGITGELDTDSNGLPIDYDSFCTLNVNVPDPFADPILYPGREGEQNPDLDDEVECVIFVDEMVELNEVNPPSGIELSNVCSFTSIDPNSERKDCIDIPSKLTIVKILDNGADDTFDFNLSRLDPVLDQTISVATTDRTGTSDVITLAEGDYNLVEDLTGNDEWKLLSAVCVNDEGIETDLLLTGGDLTLESKESEVCTFTNSLIPNPLIRITKTGENIDDGDGDDAGDRFEYDFTVTNIGNVTLNPVTVTDPLINNQEDLNFVGIDCETDPATDPVMLAPNPNNPNTPPYLDGDSAECMATYILTQTDIDNNGNGVPPDGKIYNIATANGTDPDNTVVTDMDDHMIPIEQTPLMSVVKSSETKSLNDDVPKIVTYDYTVSNDGNVTLNGVGITDDNDNDDANCASDTIAVGGSTSCTATHTFTQAELDANGSPTADSGVLFNNVTAFSNEAPDATDNLSIPIISIFLTKELNYFTNVDGSVDTNNDPTITLGDILFYKFTVTNTGSLPLTPTGSVFVEDLTFALTVTCDAAELAPGASTDCETTNGHTVTLAEANAGVVFNEAIARGVDEFGLVVTHTTPVVETPVDADPSIEIVKSTNGISASDNTSGDSPIIAIGDQVDWTYKVTNTGNVTIDNIVVEDDQVGLASCQITSLEPGEMMTCTASGLAENLLDTTSTTVLGRCGSYDMTPLYENKGTASGTVTNGTLEPDDDLSHYCNPQEGTLKLVKVVENDNGGTATVADFGITTNATGDFSFGAGDTAGTTTTYMTATVTVAKGDYTFSENDFAGYTEGYWSCDGNPAGAFGSGSITVDTQQDVVCSITNDDDAPSLTLVKHVITDNGGTAVAGNWMLHAGANTVIGSEVGALATVIAGSYALSESGGPLDYTASGWTCVGNADDGSDGMIDLGLGEDVTCTINNDDDAPKLTLIKALVKDNGGTANESDWNLVADGPTGFNGTTGVMSDASFDQGSYDLSETGPDNYTASDWVCVGGTQDDADTITLGLGEEATCTITNDDDAPKLTLYKVVDNGANQVGMATNDAWTLTATGNPATDPASLSGMTGVMSGAGFDAGTYDLSEDGPDGYVASDWSCTGNSDDGADGAITLELGDDVSCTITNISKGKSKVIKTFNGLPITGTESFSFDLRQGALPGAGGSAGTILEGPLVADAGNSGMIEFSTFLTPGETYQLCELDQGVGWSNSITDGFTPLGGLGTETDNSVECVNFTASVGAVYELTVDNIPPPGGDARTIGFWKNHTSCDGHGNQDPVLDDNLPIALGTTVDLHIIDKCAVAVDLLDKRKVGDPDVVRDGKKSAGDPIYNMVAQLVAAKLNINATAGTCALLFDAINEADELLDLVGFDGNKVYRPKGKNKGDLADAIAGANTLGGILDAYNNNELCP